MSMLEEALVYLSMGFAVYPAHSVDLATGRCSCGRVNCPCPGKHPIGRWNDFQQRLPTKREVKLWFGSLSCNIGTVTGQISGVVVVDIDGSAGVESAKGLNLAPTLTARTGGGGYHLYYSSHGPAQTRTKAYEGIDVRGDGGYVVLPPSLHNSGRFYEWMTPRPLAPFNPAPFERLSVQSSEPGWAADLLQGVGEGERSTSAARLAGRYFGMGLSVGEVWILMATWNQRNAPPLEASDLKRTVEWAKRKHEESDVTQIVTVGQIVSLLKGE